MSNGIYGNLISQLDKLQRHNRQGSFKTKRRYYEAMQRFCQFLAETYHLEKLANIAPKHLHAYVEYMQDTGHAASTIKTDLCAIRFFHDQILEPRHKLPDNAAFDLERRSFGKEDRAWSHEEFKRMVSIAAREHRDDYVTALTLAYYAGMRIEECFTIDTSMAEKALRTDSITFHGKGGRWRTVPINDIIEYQLNIMLDKVKRGNKLLLPPDTDTYHAMKRFQNFIERHRNEVQDEDSDVRLTMHGLRHSYACHTYLRFRKQGFSCEQSCKKVSELLGHNRAEVTRIYLASVLKGGEADV